MPSPGLVSEYNWKNPYPIRVIGIMKENKVLDIVINRNNHISLETKTGPPQRRTRHVDEPLVVLQMGWPTSPIDSNSSSVDTLEVRDHTTFSFHSRL